MQFCSTSVKSDISVSADKKLNVLKVLILSQMGKRMSPVFHMQITNKILSVLISKP